MSGTTQSQYQRTKDIVDAGGVIQAHAVCFHSGGFALGRLRLASATPERVIRFATHEGKAVDIAMSEAMAVELGQALIGGAK